MTTRDMAINPMTDDEKCSRECEIVEVKRDYDKDEHVRVIVEITDIYDDLQKRDEMTDSKEYYFDLRSIAIEEKVDVEDVEQDMIEERAMELANKERWML